MAGKYTYRVEVQHESSGTWKPVVTDETRDFCLGYVVAIQRLPPPRAALRIVRGDGKVIDQRDRHDRVALGIVLGLPAPEQYEDAARRAIEEAAHLRYMQYRREAREAAKRAAGKEDQ